MLHALAARACDAVEAGDELLDQCRLADPRFAGDPDHGALAAARECPCPLQPRECADATDERRRRSCARSRQLGGRERRRRRGRRRGDEAIAASRHGFDEAGLLCVVTQRRAQVADGRLQHRVADEPVPPHRIKQGILGQQRARLACEYAQQREGRGRQAPPARRYATIRHWLRRARIRRTGFGRGSDGVVDSSRSIPTSIRAPTLANTGPMRPWRPCSLARGMSGYR